MAKKDYVLLAGLLNKIKPDKESNAHSGWYVMCNMTADVLKSTNPAFDRVRFLNACRGE